MRELRFVLTSCFVVACGGKGKPPSTTTTGSGSDSAPVATGSGSGSAQAPAPAPTPEEPKKPDEVAKEQDTKEEPKKTPVQTAKEAIEENENALIAAAAKKQKLEIDLLKAQNDELEAKNKKLQADIEALKKPKPPQPSTPTPSITTSQPARVTVRKRGPVIVLPLFGFSDRADASYTNMEDDPDHRLTKPIESGLGIGYYSNNFGKLKKTNWGVQGFLWTEGLIARNTLQLGLGIGTVYRYQPWQVGFNIGFDLYRDEKFEVNGETQHYGTGLFQAFSCDNVQQGSDEGYDCFKRAVTWMLTVGYEIGGRR